MRILVIGASGMIGSTVLRVLSANNQLEVFGSVRNDGYRNFFNPSICARILSGVDVMCEDALVRIFDQILPDVVINCAGMTKHKPGSEDPLVSVPINALLPHRLVNLCKLVGARMIHVSTDCVFSGAKGNYSEEDFADAGDVYGKSKILGEVDYPNAITLRISTIGHELHSKQGLLD